jgi:hypothetical protein
VINTASNNQQSETENFLGRVMFHGSRWLSVGVPSQVLDQGVPSHSRNSNWKLCYWLNSPFPRLEMMTAQLRRGLQEFWSRMSLRVIASLSPPQQSSPLQCWARSHY